MRAIFLIAAFLSTLSCHTEEPAKKDQAFEAPIIRRIEIRGNRRTPTATVLRMLRTRVGLAFDRKTWDEDWHRLANSGLFVNVRTTPPIRIPGGVILILDFVEQPVVTRVSFEGNKSVSDEELRAIVKSREDECFSPGQAHLDAQAIEQLYQERGFKNVSVRVIVTRKDRLRTTDPGIED